MHTDRVMKVDNDNEPDTMIPIGLAALELLNRLQTKLRLRELSDNQTAQSDERAEEIKDDKKRDEQSRRYVERRIRDLAEFERRARGE